MFFQHGGHLLKDHGSFAPVIGGVSLVSVVLSAPGVLDTVYEAFSVTATFDHVVTGFDVAADVTVVNGTAADPVDSGDGKTFTIVVTPSASGTVSISVAAGVTTPLNAASNELTREFTGYVSLLNTYVTAGSLPLWIDYVTATNRGAAGVPLNPTYSGLTLGQPAPLGVANGAAWDDVGDYGSAPNDAAIYPAAFTAAVLLRPDPPDATARRLFDYDGKRYAYFGANTLAIDCIVDTDTTDARSVATKPLPADRYTWLFITYDNAGDRKIRYYVGGGGEVNQLAYTIQTAGTGTLVDPANPLYLGNIQAANRTLLGQQDEFLLFNVVLSEAQMLAIVEETPGLRGADALYLDNLVAQGLAPLWLRMTESAGGTADNVGGSGATLDGTITGCTLNQTGVFGTGEAFAWDTAGDLISVPNHADIQETAFTIGVLVNPDAADATARRLFDYDGKRYAYFGANTLAVDCIVDTDTTDARSLTTNKLTSGQWTWVFITYNNSGDRKIRIYFGVAGVVTEATYTIQTAGTGTISTPTNPFIIGNRGAGDRMFQGSMDEAFFVNRVLTSDQMSAIAAATPL